MKTPEIRLIWLILIISQLSFSNLSQNKTNLPASQPVIPTLEKGLPVKQEIKSGEIHSFIATVQAGQFAEFTVEHRGIEVTVILLSPQGKPLAAADFQNERYGREEISFVANRSGNYQIQVWASGKNPKGQFRTSGKDSKAHYEIINSELRAPSLTELKRQGARNFMVKLSGQWFWRWVSIPQNPSFSISIGPANSLPTTTELQEKFLKKHRDSLTVELVRELNDQIRFLCNQRELRSAFQTSHFMLDLAENLGDKIGIADALHNIGYIYNLRNGNMKDFSFEWNTKLWLESSKTDYAAAQENLRKSLMFREAPRDDRQRAATLKLIAAIYREQKDFRQALQFYEQSVGLFQEPNDNHTISETLVSIGDLHQFFGNSAQAEEAYQKSLRFHESTGNKELLAHSLFNLGMIDFLQGSFAAALEHYQKSLSLNEELGNLTLSAVILNRISNCYLQLGDYPTALKTIQDNSKAGTQPDNQGLAADYFLSSGLVSQVLGDYTRALELYQKSLASSEASGNQGLSANALIKIGDILFLQGRMTQANEFYQKSLKLNEAQKNKLLTVYATMGLAEVSRHQGDYSQAWEHFSQSLEVSKEIRNKPLIAGALNGLGLIYAELGNDEEAFGCFQEALKLGEETGHSGVIIRSVNNLGRIHLLRENYATALEYYQKSLALSEKIKSRSAMLDAQKRISEVYRLQRNYPPALDYGRRSLQLSEESESKLFVPEILIGIADIHFAREQFTEALEYSKRAVTLARQIESRDALWKALVSSAKAYSARQQFSESRAAFEEALQIIELSRVNIGAQSMRASYFATVQQPYELYIELLMKLHNQNPNEGYNVLALQISERSRARSLLELLNESRTDIRQGVDPELVFRGSVLQLQLNARAEQQTRLLSGSYTEEQYALLRKEILDLTVEYQNNEAQIRKQSPRYAALTQPEPLKLSEIQQEILDHETILLQYALGESRSYLWAVTRDSVKSYELPSRAEIEGMIKKAYGLLSDANLVLDDRAQLEYEAEAVRLSKTLLLPVAAHLPNKRLVIVADGALQYLPFEALPGPIHKNTRQPLIVENEMIRLPSVSALSVLRRQLKGRRPAPQTVAVIADPVFSSDDPRVRTPTGQPPQGSDLASRMIDSKENLIVKNAARQASILRQDTIQRLPFSRQEAKSILETVPTGEKMQALDFEANRWTALSPAMSEYRIIHFATHGLLNSEHPELSGIVLSLVNDEGKPIEGFLRLNEIYNLNLTAELVVLSACQTALGKEIRGEGLIGLTRGFMYAGSPRVVASLWKVDDAATAALMKLFYQKMFQEKMRPAAALRAAKIEMWKQKRWNPPFFWAAFELQGEWR